MRAACAQVVGEKDEIEFRPLCRLRDLGVMGEVHPGIGLGVRMAPRRDMMASRIEEGAEPHLALASAHDARFPIARRSCNGREASPG